MKHLLVFVKTFWAAPKTSLTGYRYPWYIRRVRWAWLWMLYSQAMSEEARGLDDTHNDRW